ncbi:MAG TPA: hypothetical protein VMH61_05760 [Candidatus Acidoferrales bacterium]|nr:hypothetical protein [Candidatus Acidoferrales bacterium]
MFPAVALAALLAVPAVASVPSPPRPAPPASGKASPQALTLVYGDDHCFGFVTPTGWVADDTSGLGSRIRMVLYPRGQKWNSAKVVMYANPIHKSKTAPLPFDQIVASDLKDFKTHTPGGVVQSGETIHTSSGKDAQLRLFSTTGARIDEAVAYIDEQPLVMLLVLSSRTPESFERALPTFRRWVQSYRFIVGNIDTPTTARSKAPGPAPTPPARRR